MWQDRPTSCPPPRFSKVNRSPVSSILVFSPLTLIIPWQEVRRIQLHCQVNHEIIPSYWYDRRVNQIAFVSQSLNQLKIWPLSPIDAKTFWRKRKKALNDGDDRCINSAPQYWYRYFDIRNSIIVPLHYKGECWSFIHISSFHISWIWTWVDSKCVNSLLMDSLYPLTEEDNLPKALLPIANTPLLYFPLEWCRKAGFQCTSFGVWGWL